MENKSKGTLWWPMALLLLVTATSTMEVNNDEFKDKETPTTYTEYNSDEDDSLPTEELEFEEPLPAATHEYHDQQDDDDDEDDDDDDDDDDDIEEPYNDQNVDNYDSDSDEQEDDLVNNSPNFEKRNIGALARKGDMAARRIQSANSDVSPLRIHRNYAGPDDNWQSVHESIKRHIGSFARSGGHRRPGKARIGKRDYNELDQMMTALVKRNIASLARKGTLANLRFQRRPISWMGGDDDEYGYNSVDPTDYHDGYKRNMHAFSRVTTPGSGFRTWLRERLSANAASTSMMKDAKRKNNYSHFRLISGGGGGGLAVGRYGSLGGTNRGGRLGSKDRFRGIRSTRHRYLNPEDVSGRHGGSSMTSPGSFRAPMAFVSRHHLWKRAINGGALGFLRGLRDDQFTSAQLNRNNENDQQVEIM